jgi:hypothetical protein
LCHKEFGELNILNGHKQLYHSKDRPFHVQRLSIPQPNTNGKRFEFECEYCETKFFSKLVANLVNHQNLQQYQQQPKAQAVMLGQQHLKTTAFANIKTYKLCHQGFLDYTCDECNNEFPTVTTALLFSMSRM